MRAEVGLRGLLAFWLALATTAGIATDVRPAPAAPAGCRWALASGTDLAALVADSAVIVVGRVGAAEGTGGQARHVIAVERWVSPAPAGYSSEVPVYPQVATGDCAADVAPLAANGRYMLFLDGPHGNGQERTAFAAPPWGVFQVSGGRLRVAARTWYERHRLGAVRDLDGLAEDVAIGRIAAVLALAGSEAPGCGAGRGERPVQELPLTGEYRDPHSAVPTSRLLAGARDIFIGRIVESVVTFALPPRTVHTIEVERWLSGTRDDVPRELRMAQFGAVIGCTAAYHAGDPLMQEGQRYLFISGGRPGRRAGAYSTATSTRFRIADGRLHAAPSQCGFRCAADSLGGLSEAGAVRRIRELRKTCRPGVAEYPRPAWHTCVNPREMPP